MSLRLSPAVVAFVLLLSQALPASGQDWPGPVSDVFKQVVLDPTTYAPAALSFTAERLDWKSSQVFFQHGYVEHNPEFTISRRPDDVPIGYGAGNRRITANALADLAASAMNNVSSRVVERLLIARFPQRQKMIRALGWIERIAFAASLATIQSSNHFRQWRKNERLARELGYR
jgi:hypothetical protein